MQAEVVRQHEGEPQIGADREVVGVRRQRDEEGQRERGRHDAFAEDEPEGRVGEERVGLEDREQHEEQQPQIGGARDYW